MELATYIISIILLLPVCASIICLLLTFFSWTDSVTILDRRVKICLSAYFVSTTGVWSLLFCYIFYPAIFVWGNTLLLLFYMLVPVLFYRIIFIIAEEGRGSHFSRWHYVAPVLFSAALTVWCLMVPFDTTLPIVELKGTVIPEGYEAYYYAFISKQFWFAVSETVYFAFTIYTLYRYYCNAAQPESLVRKPAAWVVFLMVLSAALVLTGIVATAVSKINITTSIWIPITALVQTIQYLLLTYHIIRHTYRLYTVAQPDKKPDSENPDKEKAPRREHHGAALTRKNFEEYFRKEKPWLNPAFRITDMVEYFDLNRSVISAFINKTYGVNFNRYLNRRRLKELNRLQKLAENRDKNTAQLLAQAGFTNGKHYLRALRAEETPEGE